jgi:hypothetical protein
LEFTGTTPGFGFPAVALTVAAVIDSTKQTVSKTDIIFLICLFIYLSTPYFFTIFNMPLLMRKKLTVAASSF